MTERLIPTTRTTPTLAEFAEALLREWPEASKEAAGVLYAQFAGETGDGRFCWNWNLGNVKHVRGDGYDYVSLAGVWEGLRFGDEDRDGDVDADDRVLFVARMVRSGLWREDPSADHAKAVGPGKVSLIATGANTATWFRAYPNLATAMASFIKSKRSGQWAASWAFVEAGDPDGYARALGRMRYYSASPDAYSKALAAKHAAWMKSNAFELAQRKIGLEVSSSDDDAPDTLVDFQIVHRIPDTTE